jgi:hypothetical protein
MWLWIWTFLALLALSFVVHGLIPWTRSRLAGRGTRKSPSLLPFGGRAVRSMSLRARTAGWPLPWHSIERTATRAKLSVVSAAGQNRPLERASSSLGQGGPRERDIEGSPRRAMVSAALNSLSDREKEVILLAHAEGLRLAEVAEVLNIMESKAAEIYQEALDQFLHHLIVEEKSYMEWKLGRPVSPDEMGLT